MSANCRPRQLVLCCDGTNSNLTGGDGDTNVVKLAMVLARLRQSTAQTLFYDPGVGNAGALPGVTFLDRLERTSERVAGLAFGRGVYENMAQSYLFLMRNYQPDDQIYIFGSSRGAFTARSIAGMINMFGILQPHMEPMIATLLHVYFSDRRDNAEKMARIAKQSQALFCVDGARAVNIQYIGVWDTVASVGLWPFEAKITATPTVRGKRYLNVRHALALDEHRAQFKPRLYADENGEYTSASGLPVTLEQKWFRGSHRDVGGGYGPGQTRLSDKAFQWIVSEAVKCGLDLATDQSPLDSEDKVAAALHVLYPPAPTGFVHSELHNSCLWALTGMAVRDTRAALVDGHAPYAVVPVEHSSVADDFMSYPKDTAWAKVPRSTTVLKKCMVTAILLLPVLGWMLTGTTYSDSYGYDASHLGDFLLQNFRFWRWQTFWLFEGNALQGITNFASPRWALVADLGLIAAYTYVLAWFSVPAVARHAGLRRAGDDPLPWLEKLGWALPLMVGSDVLENVCTWVAITFLTVNWSVPGLAFAVLMSICSVAKCIGFVGVMALLAMPQKPP